MSFRLDHAGGGGGGASSIMLAFAAQNMAAAPSTNFLFPGNGATASALVTVVGSFVALFDGNLNSFFVNHRNPSGAADITYNMLIEGIVQAPATVVLSSGLAGPQSVLAVNVAVLQGQRINVTAVLPAGAPINARPVWQCLLTEL